MNKTYLLVFGIILLILSACNNKSEIPFVSEEEQKYIVETATGFLDSLPVSVTSAVCERSVGGPHDFY